jgi:hypothetical protein
MMVSSREAKGRKQSSQISDPLQSRARAEIERLGGDTCLGLEDKGEFEVARIGDGVACPYAPFVGIGPRKLVPFSKVQTTIASNSFATSTTKRSPGMAQSARQVPTGQTIPYFSMVYTHFF